MFSLNNKTALVTGGSRGISRATVLALANAGAHVIVHYERATDEANAPVREIRAKGGKADAIGDKLDVVVANAGVSGAATITEQTVADFDRYYAINVRAPYFLVQQLLPLLHDGSSVILISSKAAGPAVGNLPAHAAPKGADDTLVKYFAAALGPQGIRINAVAPGAIDTDMSDLTKTEECRKAALGVQALRRIGKPDDIADVVAFLASNGARWITGTTIHVDGGSTL
jgi:NAD(P)-dependent dehydrogenase (short-subunit alcohol dehydrogenase family)